MTFHSQTRVRFLVITVFLVVFALLVPYLQRFVPSCLGLTPQHARNEGARDSLVLSRMYALLGHMPSFV